MAILGDIEVRIASRTTGKALDEYDKPDTVLSKDGLSIEKFIKAETGLEFHIEILVKPSFNFYGASGVQIRIDIDGDRVAYRQYWSQGSLLKKYNEKNPVIFDDVLHKEGTQYSRIRFNFGSLDINEELDVEKETLDRQADSLGSIKVSLVRANRVKRSNPIPETSHYKPSTTTGVAKEVAKDRNVSNTMKPGKKTLVDTPRPRTHKTLPYPIKNACPFNFIFRYRSQMDLELLGCNPRDTEPVPLLVSQRASRELISQNIKQSTTQMSKPRDGEEPTNAKGDNDQTATEEFGVTQGMENVATEQPQKKSLRSQKSIERNDKSMEVESDQDIIKPEESGGFMEVRTEVRDLEKENRQLFQANQLLNKENVALKQTKEKMAALIQNLMGDMTNASAIPPAAVLTSTLPISPAALSNPPTLTPPSMSIKREQIKEEDHEEGSHGSTSTRNRPSKRTKTVDLTAE